MNKRDMLENLINYYTDGNRAKFAAKLGVNAQNISAWLNRSTFDAELIYCKCENVSASWLLSGYGDMINTNEQNVCIEKQIEYSRSRELIGICKELIDNYKQRDNIIDKLVSITK